MIVINGNLDNQKRSYLYYLKKNLNLLKYFIVKIGIHNALNYGVDKSKYNIIFRADSDDVNFKNRFKKQLHFFIKNKLDILGAVNIEVYNKNSCYIKKLMKNQN